MQMIKDKIVGVIILAVVFGVIFATIFHWAQVFWWDNFALDRKQLYWKLEAAKKYKLPQNVIDSLSLEQRKRDSIYWVGDIK